MKTAREEFSIEFKASLSKIVCGVSSLEDEVSFWRNWNFRLPPDKTAWFLKGVACVLLEFILEVKNENRPVPQTLLYKDVAVRTNSLLTSWNVDEGVRFPLRGNALSNQLGWILGLLSTFSWFSAGIWITSIVQPQRGNKPSSGFYDLVFQLTGKYPTDGEIFEFQKQVFEKLI